MEDEIEDIASTTDEVTPSIEEEVTPSVDDEDIEDLRRKNNDLYARAKKAEAQLKEQKVAEKPKEKKAPATEDEINRVLDRRELESLDFSDEIQQEIADYAKLKGVSIRKAASSAYITFRKEDTEQKQRVEAAALGNKSKAPVKRDFGNIDHAKLDPRTKEGKEDFARVHDHLRNELG